MIIETDDGVDLLPATIELARAEADLLTRTGREHVINASAARGRSTSYDWVLLDCPPSLGVLTVAALTAADGVLIPLQCETLSHRGVGQLLDTVHDVRRFTNRKLEVWGVLPTLYDGRTNHARAVLETISRDLRPRRDRAADPEVDPVRRGARRRPVDPGAPARSNKGADGLPRGRGQASLERSLSDRTAARARRRHAVTRTAATRSARATTALGAAAARARCGHRSVARARRRWACSAAGQRRAPRAAYAGPPTAAASTGDAPERRRRQPARAAPAAAVAPGDDQAAPPRRVDADRCPPAAAPAGGSSSP